LEDDLTSIVLLGVAMLEDELDIMVDQTTLKGWTRGKKKTGRWGR